MKQSKPTLDKSYIYVGALSLPIPAPSVLGGIFGVWGTFIGLVVAQLIQDRVAF